MEDCARSAGRRAGAVHSVPRALALDVLLEIAVALPFAHDTAGTVAVFLSYVAPIGLVVGPDTLIKGHAGRRGGLGATEAILGRERGRHAGGEGEEKWIN